MVLYLHDAIAQLMTPTCLRRRLYVVFHVPHKLPVPDIAGTRVHTRVGDKYIGQKLISHVRSMIWCHVQRASHMAMPLMTLTFMNSHSANQKGTQTYTDVRIISSLHWTSSLEELFNQKQASFPNSSTSNDCYTRIMTDEVVPIPQWDTPGLIFNM